MSRPIIEVLREAQLEVLFTALTHYRNHCKNHASRGITGYGSAKEAAKREKWKERMDETDAIISLIAEETT